MRFSELGSKEIVNLYDGERLGMLGETDLVIDEESGDIVEVLVPSRHGIFRPHRAMSLFWSSIRRVGPEVIIVEVAPEALGTSRRAKP